MSYPKRVAANILPLSRSQSLPAAFREWHFTGSTTDHEGPVETCKLCDQQGLRYHFEISNDTTSHSLEVGSECILRFQVSVFEDGRELSADEAKKALNDRMRQMRLDSCLRALERLAQAEDNNILASALDYYKRNGALSPKLANVVFWRLQANSIDHDPSFFKVLLDRTSLVEDFRNLPPIAIRRMWKALSPAQRKKALSLGHKEPISSN